MVMSWTGDGRSRSAGLVGSAPLAPQHIGRRFVAVLLNQEVDPVLDMPVAFRHAEELAQRLLLRLVRESAAQRPGLVRRLLI